MDTPTVTGKNDIGQLLKEFAVFEQKLKGSGVMTEAEIIQAVAFAMAFRNHICSPSL